ncbi:MAG: RdgB/HAM1 family non-canonical purine NTP pyrophosphatase [Phycisphaerae bacterium]|nr:RdgB/HAM1 family non-canonical purine NTP pyrophosphatase [Phycisphaerae bacterium]
MKLLIATSNPGKLREFRQMLGDDRFQWDDLSLHPNIPVPEETGLTFRANAMLKAAFYARHVCQWALADDSGLEVDALAGRPGVHSARWAQMHGVGTGDGANNLLLLQQLRTLHIPPEQRTARFRCVLALSDPRGRIVFTCSGSIEGRILEVPRGDNGFGYDPLFLVDSIGKTTAELAPAQKHAISHRGLALRRMRELMDAHLPQT